MNKICKWLEKQDKTYIILLVLVGLTVWNKLIDDTIMNIVFSTIMLPLFVWMFQIFMKKSINNNEFNIEVEMSKERQDKIIWKLENEEDKNDYSYIVVRNVGGINIYTLFFKIYDYKNIVNYYKITEALQVDDKIFVRVPYKLEEIKEVIVTCELPGEYRTKRFYGVKSGDEYNTIFGQRDMITIRKKAIVYDKEYENKVEKMIKYKLNK